MSTRSTTTHERVAPELTDEQVEALIAERKSVGATSCTVVRDDGQRFLVCQWPPL